MRPLAAAWLVLLPTLAGCMTPAPGSDLAAPAGDPARPEAMAPVFEAPVVLPYLGGNEPGLLATDQDHLFVTTTSTGFWRSFDGGATWEALSATCSFPEPMCVNSNSLEGGADASLAIDRRGRLHWAGLALNSAVPYQWSDDEGLNWSEPFDVAEGTSPDREWIVAGPGDDLYVVWRAYGGEDVERRAVAVRASRDLGATWEPWSPIVEVESVKVGAATAGQEPPLLGRPAIDARSGALYVPLSPLHGGPVQVARSLDRGASWDLVDLPGRSEDFLLAGQVPHSKGNIFPVVAVDEAGTVYASWSEDRDAPEALPSTGGKTVMVPKVYLAVSRDQGATWSEAMPVSPPDRAAVFPAIAAGAPGRVGLAWYESAYGLPPDNTPQPWFVTLALSTSADSAAPTWAAAATTAEPVHVGRICTAGAVCAAGGDRTRGDFLDVAIRPDGMAVVAYVQDVFPPGEEGRSTDVVVARVADGPPLR